MRKLAYATILLALSTPANAILTFDAVLPTQALAGQTIHAQLTAGVCDAVVESPGFPEISQNGAQIRMLLETAYADNPIFCNFGPVITFTLPVGTYPAGRYTLQVDRHYIDTDGQSITASLGSRTITVHALAQPAPVLTAPGYIVLVGLMLLSAGFALKRRTVQRG